ncbi:PAS domain S-box protein [Halomicroarcula sp. F13]|uniref:histidine kinase n=1 Tax=Haloarcula rubra TaxID=2487747 RepID=A0AAW4PQR9_9EURY|nr:PAS domain S-box protein [Halomicroarcula rubra]MBX0323591.1 PAS domain S-box protein [Halomicroarcula rubra]
MYGFFVASLYATAVISLLFAGVAWRKRGDPGGTPMVVFHLALAVGAAAYARDIVATTLAAQLPWAMVSAVAQGVTAIAWLYAALQYSGFERTLTRRVVGLLSLEPVLLALGFLTPAVTIAEWPSTGLTGSLLQAGETTLTTLFFFHSVTILLAALAGTILLIRLFVRSRHLYRTQSAAVLVAALTPWTVGLTQNFFVNLPEDASIFAWGLSGMALTAGLYTFKKLDPVPAAQAAIVENMGDGAVVLDVDGVVGDANPAARRLLGFESESLVGRHIADVVDGWDGLDWDDPDASGWQELPLTGDGDPRFVEVEVSPFTDRFDDVVGRLVVLRDVTERKRREQRLAQYKTIFDAVNEPVYVLDENDNFVRYNAPFADLVGYDESALVGSPFAAVLAGGETATDGDGVTEVTITTASGEEVPCEADLAAVELASGATGRVGIVRDISQRKAMESELAQTTERLETLVEASPLAIVAHDTEGVVDVWNPAAESLFGWRAEAVRGEPLPIVPDDRETELMERHREVQSGNRLTGYETELEREDGSLFSAAVSAAPITDTNGTVVGTVSVIADISERKAQQRLLERQNERLDEFASLVSHDLRNPLQVATGNLELARADATGTVRDRIDAAGDALERMEALVDKTLSLAREGRDIGATERTDIGALAERAWRTVQTEGHSLSVDASPTVECDPDRVAELFENLFRNAVEHGQNGTDAPLTLTVGELPDGFYVADDGVGVPADVRDRVFESGYTTSPDGTGFGLAIVQTIADAHGWDVTLTESESGGARFEFAGVERTT